MKKQVKNVASQLKSIKKKKNGNLYSDKCLQKAIPVIEWRQRTLRGQLAVISQIGICHTFIGTFTFASVHSSGCLCSQSGAFQAALLSQDDWKWGATQLISILLPQWRTIFMIASCCLHARTPVRLKVPCTVLSRSSIPWLGALWLLLVIPRFPLSRQAKTHRPDGQCADQDPFTRPHFLELL